MQQSTDERRGTGAIHKRGVKAAVKVLLLAGISLQVWFGILGISLLVLQMARS
ncbi:MAG: hypothetical protein ACK41P_01770 [Asticcacaulis sp.]